MTRFVKSLGDLLLDRLVPGTVAEASACYTTDGEYCGGTCWRYCTICNGVTVGCWSSGLGCTGCHW